MARRDEGVSSAIRRASASSAARSRSSRSKRGIACAPGGRCCCAGQACRSARRGPSRADAGRYTTRSAPKRERLRRVRRPRPGRGGRRVRRRQPPRLRRRGPREFCVASSTALPRALRSNPLRPAPRLTTPSASVGDLSALNSRLPVRRQQRLCPLLPVVEAECAQKIPPACGFAGFLYERGRGVAADAAMAASFYNQACEAGDQHGLCGLRAAAGPRQRRYEG